MQNDNSIRELIQSELSEAVELGFDTEEALAKAAGLITDAELTFVRLSRAIPSMPPPRR